jgi:glucose-fructose oxidoreductase
MTTISKSRREFIKKSAMVLAGTGLATHSFSMPGILTGKQKKVGVALVGLGYYSTDLLAPALQETQTAYLAGIVTGTKSKEEVWMNKYQIPRKNVYNYENFGNIAANPDIDVVYVVLPNSLHKEFVIRAARAGKHVICEKPMAVNADECREMIAACKENGVQLSIGYRMQFEPFTQEVMRLGQERVFGNVLQITAGAAFRNSSTDHWKQKRSMGGGAMMDMGVYPLQAARYVTGEEPVKVNARSYVTRPEIYTEAEEVMLFDLEFPSGSIATLSTGFHANYNYLKVFAEKGWFELDPFSGYRGIKGKTSKEMLEFPDINQQATQMDEVAECILSGEPMRVPGEEGLKDMIVVDKIYKSAQAARFIG